VKRKGLAEKRRGGRAVQGGRAASAERSAHTPTLRRFLRDCDAFGLADADVAPFRQEVRALFSLAQQVARTMAAEAEASRSTVERIAEIDSGPVGDLARAHLRLARASRTEGGRP
jgi:hypothetical protein